MTAGAGSFVAGVASLGTAGVSGGNALSSFLISSLVRDGGAGTGAGGSGFVTGGLARASSAFLKASARSREDWGFGDKGSAGAGVTGLGVLLGMGRAGATSLGTVISWSRFCNDATWGARVAFATVGGVGAIEMPCDRAHSSVVGCGIECAKTRSSRRSRIGRHS